MKNKCKHTIEEMVEIANSKNGKCLSQNYLGYDGDLKWECSEGHIFNKNPRYIFRGRWCDKCSRFKRQNLCNYIFENLTGVPFRTKKIKFENYENLLEIDGYNEELKIGFEYQGIQHYEKTIYSKNLVDIQKRDLIKLKDSESLGIKLLIIKYDLTDSEIVNKITEFLTIYNINIIKNNIVIKDFYDTYSYLTNKIKDIKNIIESKEGELLSYTFNKCSIKCKRGHTWETFQYSINMGCWCRECSEIPLYNIYEYMSDMIKNNSLELITNKNEFDLQDQIKIKCNKNHITEINKKDIPFRINSKRVLCTKCIKEKRTNPTIEKLKNIEKEFNVNFDFDKYENKYSILKYVCNYCNKESDECCRNILGRYKRKTYICAKCKKGTN